MRSLLTLLILFSFQALGARGRSFIIEPEIGVSYAKWSQEISSPAYEGKMGGNNMGYRYGANLHYALSNRITFGYSYKQDELTWGYAQSSATGDDD